MQTATINPKVKEVLGTDLKPMSRGVELDISAGAFGFLNELTDDPIENIEAAKAAYERDGYLYVKGFWDREDVMACREEITDALLKMNLLDPEQPPMEAFPHPDNLTGIADSSKGSATIDGVANESELIKSHLYSGKTIAFYEAFLGHEVNHFDNVWLRAMAPGFGTVPHSDRVFMGRGTDNVMVCWHPYGDIDIRTGGLIILDSTAPGTENEKKLEPYWSSDVDEYCSNEPFPEHVDLESTSDNKVWNGALSGDPVNLQAELGGRWLTSPNFEMGDLLTFSLKLVHASLDNQSDRLRISSDTRYQRSDEPADERWIGPAPRGHVGYHKRGRVC